MIKFYRVILFSLVTFALATQCACSSHHRNPSQRNAMPDDFSNVAPNSFRSYPCSPQPAVGDFSFRGILLAGPGKVEFRPGGKSRDLLSDAFADMIVCGSATFDYNFMGLKGRFLYKITFFAVDRGSHRSYSGTIVPRGVVIPPATQEVSEEEGAMRIVTSFFNPNLVSTLSLPSKAGVYDVYAQLGEHRSNVVTIEMIECAR